MQSAFDKLLTSLEVRRPVLVAVSGGVDSMCMLDLFLNSSLNIPFTIAHCNFHLRGAESDSDEALVTSWAASHGVKLLKKDFDTVEYSKTNGISIEMAARELRYSWFASLSDEFPVLAVAHNANDNAETLILNLLRGTGVKGMTGMKVLSSLSESMLILRPLLRTSREEILEYAQSHSLEWHEDRTNADVRYKRNSVRNEIFPIFKKINPSFLNTLSEDAERFAQVQDVADTFFESAKKSVCTGTEPLEINVKALLTLEHWEYVLFRLLSPYGFQQAVLKDIERSLCSDGTLSGKQFLSQEYVALASSTTLSVLPFGDDASDKAVIVTGPGEYSLCGCRILVSESAYNPQDGVIKSLGTTSVDSDVVPFPFVLRQWQEGDWLRPIGLKTKNGNQGRKKLSDLFVDLKLSLMDKKKAIVIAGDGSHIFSLVGFRTDESVKISGSTHSVTTIKII